MNGYEYISKEKPRFQQINEEMVQNIKTIYRLRKVGYDTVDSKSYRSYAISLEKSRSLSLEEQVLSVYNLLESILLSGEILVTENRCLKIISHLYETEYSIETWGKSANQISYIQEGKVVTELLHRMSCEQAAHIFKKHGIIPFELLNTLATLQKYKNHADKYVALSKMSIFLAEYNKV